MLLGNGIRGKTGPDVIKGARPNYLIIVIGCQGGSFTAAPESNYDKGE